MYKKILLLSFLVSFSTSVFSEAIYKCKDENGQVSFSYNPCNVMKLKEGKVGESSIMDYDASTSYRAGELKRLESQNRASASSESSNWREKRARKLLKRLPYGKVGDRFKREHMLREAEMLLRK